MEAVFLTTPELLQEFSARVLHTLHSAGADAVCDDFTADDLLRLAHEGRVVIGVFLDDGGAVAMVMVLEFVPYPRRMVLNVVLMAGKGVRKFCRRAWEPLVQYAKAAGADAIVATSRPAIARVLARFTGLRDVSRVLQFELKGDGNGQTAKA